MLENRTLLSWVIPEQSDIPEHLYEGSQVQFTETIGLSGWDYATIIADGQEYSQMPNDDFVFSVDEWVDDNRSFVVTVTDNWNQTDTFTTDVENVAPWGTLNVDLGDNGDGLVTVGLSDIQEPSQADRNAGVGYAWGYDYAQLQWNWANNGTTEAAYSFDPSMDEDQQYYIRVGDKDGGYSDYSSTLGAFPTLNVKRDEVTSTSIPFQWIDTASGESHWIVQRAVFGGNFSTIATLDGVAGVGSPISFTDTGLSPDVRFVYRVRAEGNGADTPYSPKTYQRTLVPAPTNVQAIEDPSAGTIHVTWDVTGGYSYSGFTLNVYNGDQQAGDLTLLRSFDLDADARSFDINNPRGLSYQFALSANSANGNSSSQSGPVLSGTPGYAWTTIWWDPMDYNRPGWPHPSWPDVNFDVVRKDGLDINDNPLESGDTGIVKVSGLPTHSRVRIAVMDTEADAGDYGVYMPDPRTSEEYNAGDLDVDPRLEVKILGPSRPVPETGKSTDVYNYGYMWDNEASMGTGEYYPHHGSRFNLSMKLSGLPDQWTWGLRDLYLWVYVPVPAGNAGDNDGAPPGPSGDSGGDWPGPGPDPGDDGSDGPPDGGDGGDDGDPDPDDDPNTTENWDNLVIGGWPGFLKWYDESTIETYGYSNSDDGGEPGNPPPLNRSVFIPVNDGYDEGNLDANYDPVPDNQADYEAADQLDRDVAPMWLDLWTTEQSGSGSVSLSYDDSKIMLWAWSEDVGAWVPVTNPTLTLDADKWHGGDQRGYERMYFLVEGIAPSTNPHDVPVTASFNLGSAGTAEDTAGFTVNAEGLLVAFDGTWDWEGNVGRKTVVQSFYGDYTGDRSKRIYKRGVGNAGDYPKDKDLGGNLLQGAMGLEAIRIVNATYSQVVDFYQDAGHRQSNPLDIIGLSRGAYQAVALANLVSSRGIPNLKSEFRDVDLLGRVTYGFNEYFIKPTIRFIGLVSPVGQMGLDPLISIVSLGHVSLNLGWPTSAPGGTQHFVQALDNQPNDILYPQTTIGHAGAADYHEQTFADDHPTIGVDPAALKFLEDQARADDLPIPPAP